MITALHQVFGRKYRGLFKIPYFDVTRTDFNISTRSQDLVVKKLDGTTSNYTTSKLIDATLSNNSYEVGVDLFTSTYGSSISGDIEITSLGGNSDIYSLFLNGGLIQNTTTSKLNIQDFGNFIKQFPNLYSYRIFYSCYGENNRMPIIKGDLADVPASVERIRLDGFEVLNNSTDVYFNFNSFPVNSQLKYFNYDGVGTLKFIGDLAKLPINCRYFKTVRAANTSSISYSSKAWASSFDTLDIGNATLSDTETDNLFNDMANSINTAIGGKIIRLVNCYRTSASNTAVTYLQSLGFTITVLGTLTSAIKILDLPLQNNFTDTTGINTMIAGGTSNLPTFTLEGSEYGATFNGSQSMKTNANFIIGTDKVSISFWIKTNQTALANIVELSASLDSNDNTFITLINGSGQANKFQFVDRNGSYYVTNTSNNINDNAWHHIVIVYDRALNGSLAGKLYVDNVLVTNTTLSNDLNGIFGNFPLFIGQRGGTTRGFNGQMKFLKIFNYPLSTTEITNLYNKTM